MAASNSSSNSQIHEKIDENTEAFYVTLDDIDEKLGLRKEERPPKKSIFQAPDKLRKFNEDSYSPRVVSIGPIHHGKSELIAVEELKWTYTVSFFYRRENAADALEECYEKIVNLEDKARNCYASDFKKLSKYQLAQILLIDGCFLLELLLRNSKQLKLKFQDKGVINIEEDPILNNNLMVRAVQQDLALLENQIPFVVLETLLHCIDDKIPSSRITNYALRFFGAPLVKFGEGSPTNMLEADAVDSINLHLLKILHNNYHPASRTIDVSVSGTKKKQRGFKLGARPLYGCGLQFKMSSSEHLLDIRFDEKKGVIRIPQFRVGGIMSSRLRNLVAFEQCNFSTTHHMTAYAMLMRSLISCPKDVEFLIKEDILQLELGSSEDVLGYFKNLCDEFVPKDYYFDGLCQRVADYTASNWNLHRRRVSIKVWYHNTMATMRHNYLPDPFRKLSVFAAFVLLLFTGLQTFYTVRSYYPR